MATSDLKAATGIAKSRTAEPKTVELAIQRAMEKIEITQASNVLLFLTSEFASDPHSAIKAAAKTAQTTQIMGCSATGIFTEEEWVLDSPAAAAIVFNQDVFSSHHEAKIKSEYLLTLAAPSALNANWLASKARRFGGISGDATGRGPFSVWQNGKGTTQSYCELAIQGCDTQLMICHGLKQISSPRRVTEVDDHDLISIASMPALKSLSAALEIDVNDLPYHLLMVAHASTAKALEEGAFQVASIIVANAESGTVTCASQIKQGDWICWMMRDTTSAAQEVKESMREISTSGSEPSFAMMFSCLGRGPYFYNGVDQDLKLLKERFPSLPVIGFYGNGQIAPLPHTNTLLQYSSIISFFSPHDQG